MPTLRRRAARVAVLDREDRVLLLRSVDPVDASRGEWWELPGGGIEAGETTAEAAARELYEETGLTGVEMGPVVWRHYVEFDFAGYHLAQHEDIHVARSDGGEVRAAALEGIEVDAFVGYRWVPVGELADLEAAGDRIVPDWLAARLPAVLAEGLPAEPFELGPQADR